MMDNRLIAVAQGQEPADVIIRGGQLVNVQFIIVYLADNGFKACHSLSISLFFPGCHIFPIYNIHICFAFTTDRTAPRCKRVSMQSPS